MKYIYLSIFFCIALGLSGCLSNKTVDEPDIEHITVNLDSSKDFVNEIANMQVTRLTEDDDFSPGDFSKTQWKGDTLFILDSFKSKGLYVYGPDGNLIKSYREYGHGPKEFLGLSDFLIKDNEIVLLDTYGSPNRIILDSELNFLRKEEAEDKASHFFEDSDGGIWYDKGNIAYDMNEDKLIYYKDGVRKGVLEIPENLKNITFSNPNSFCLLKNGSIGYLPALEPYVYECKNGEAKKLFMLDFGEKWPIMDKKASATHPLQLMKDIVDKGEIFGLDMFSDNDHIVFTFRCKDLFYILIVDQNIPDNTRLLHIDEAEMDNFGSFLSIHNGSLIFGQDSRIISVDLKTK